MVGLLVLLLAAGAWAACDGDAVAAATRVAEAVFTARVDALGAGGVAAVTVKRVLKNQGSPLRDGDQVLVRVGPEDRNLNAIEEEDPWCESARLLRKSRARRLRVKDTKLFMTRALPEGRLRRHGDAPLELTTPPLTLTLELLDRASAAVKDIVYKPRPPVIEEPCEKTYCQFGADCVTRSDGSPHCECPADCPSVFTPVCGTDGVTYSNHCLMRLQACQHSRNIRVQYGGECGARSRPKGHSGE